MRILQINDPRQISRVMQDIQVDPYGIKIMLPKAASYLIKIKSVSNISANILKQEMLSLGADAAVARGALTGSVKKTDCLLMGTLSQFKGLSDKLNKQPFGLDKISKELANTLNNYQKDKFILRARNYKLNFGRRTFVMGIINVTPDSFSGDGLYEARLPYIVDYAKKLVRDGADIVDVGGESSRPDAKPVSLKEELKRVISVIKALAKNIKAPISVDTCKPEVAKQALDNGATIINNICGLKSPRMAKAIAGYKAGVVIMHMQGSPSSMQDNPCYTSLIDEILQYLNDAIKKALDAGIDKNNIIIDPGIGFGKTASDNLKILNHLREFKVLGSPIMVGTSRKSFIGKILNVGPQDRIFGTISSCVLAARNGASIVRVHDVLEVRQALKVLDAVNKS